jgi:TPR repeat protein
MAMLIGDRERAQTSFLRAYDGGDLIGTLIVGLILFHGIGVEKDMLKGCQFLAKCMIDLTALLHFSAALKEPVWLDRAAMPMNTKINELTKLYGCVGDLFFDGVKLPREFRITIRWHENAAMQSEIEGANNHGILEKIGRLI